MTALAADVLPSPAPVRTRPALVSELRPWDRIAFRGRPPARGADDDADVDAVTGPHPLPGDLPAPDAWCATLVRTVVEALLGARPPAQLARWLTADLYAGICRRAQVGLGQRTDARRVRVLRVHVCPVDATHHEASVVLHDGRRVRAAAVRIEVFRGRWRATVLDIA